MERSLPREAYTVGWVCAIWNELGAARAMLDASHKRPEAIANDGNIYNLGQIKGHNVVIACLPQNKVGIGSAAGVAKRMRLAFPSIRFFLMVGIAGGVPSKDLDIRLGDVVVSVPEGMHPGVVQYDFGKIHPDGIERTGPLRPPPEILLQAVANIRANHLTEDPKFLAYAKVFDEIEKLGGFSRKLVGEDILFKEDYVHVGGATCDGCNRSKAVIRQQRSDKVVVHYGTIASGNWVMRDAKERDRISKELGRVLCFEMEAAGLMDSLPCLVVRGICDYADSHKNKKWQQYAAGMAAAYAKEILTVVPPAAGQQMVRPGVDAINQPPVTNSVPPYPTVSNSIGSGFSASHSAAPNSMAPNFAASNLLGANIVFNMPKSEAPAPVEPKRSRNKRKRHRTNRREVEDTSSDSDSDGWDFDEYNDDYRRETREFRCFRCE